MTTNSINSDYPTLDGELIIGQTGGNPVAATLTAGSGVGVSNGAGSISLSVTGYDEGTFTPGIEGSSTAGTPTYSIQQGRYIKIGNTVMVSGVVRWSALSGSAGNLRLTGLPFTVLNQAGYFPASGVAPESISSSSVQVSMEFILNTARAVFNNNPNDGSTGDSAVAHNAWYGGSPTIAFSGNYRVE